MTRTRLRRLSTLKVSAGIEFATGALLLAAPAVVTELLLGSAAEGQESVLARLLGGGLISLGTTGLLAGDPPASRGAIIGFTVYNGATVALLGVAGAHGNANGVLLWPVVLVHGVVAIRLLLEALSRQPADASSSPVV